MQKHITGVLLQRLHRISLTNADFELVISPFFCLCQQILILTGTQQDGPYSVCVWVGGR